MWHPLHSSLSKLSLMGSRLEPEVREDLAAVLAP